MKGLHSLFIGLFATFAFSWIGLALIPNMQIGHLDPQMDEEGTDIYPMPPSGMAVRGQKIYIANGCYYCHSEQVRPAYIASDIDRPRDAQPSPSPAPKWAARRSAPRDYIFQHPALLGKERLGPDLANIGKAGPSEDQAAAAPAAAGAPAASPAASPAPNVSPAAAPAKPAPSPAAAASPAAAVAAAPAPAPPESATPSGQAAPYTVAWHHRHLYSPRALNLDSNMPAYRFLYETRRIVGQPSTDALQLGGDDKPADGYEVVPTYDARCLVAYLMSLDQTHPLKEVKNLGGGRAAPVAPASPAPAAPAAASPAAK